MKCPKCNYDFNPPYKPPNFDNPFTKAALKMWRKYHPLFKEGKWYYCLICKDSIGRCMHCGGRDK